MTDIHQIRKIAGKIMEQTATAQELEIFRQYLSSRNKKAVMDEVFVQDAFSRPKQVLRLDEAEKQQMLQHILSHSPVLKQKKPFKMLPVLARVAAVLILCLGAYAVLRWMSNTSRKPIYTDVYTAYGEQKVLWMPDSTRIVLNAGSRLSYAFPYSDDKQEVFLEGEAFFEVAHAARRSFVVHSGKLSTTVLGTSFNVRAYKADPVISVQVKTGKVQVALADRMVTLLPARQAVYLASTGQLQTRDVNTADIAGWTSNRLIFDDQPVMVILNELERVYNIRFNAVNKAALTRRYTIRLNRMTLTYTLETVSALTGLQFQRKDAVIVVK